MTNSLCPVGEWQEAGPICARLFQLTERACNNINGKALLRCQSAISEASPHLYQLLFSRWLEGKRIAYRILLHLAMAEMKEQAQSTRAHKEDTNEELKESEKQEEPPIPSSLRHIIEAPPQESQRESLGFLLAWSLLFDRLSLGEPAMRSAVGTYFRQSGVLSPFLFTLFQHIDLQSDLPVPSPAEITSFKVTGECPAESSSSNISQSCAMIHPRCNSMPCISTCVR